MRRKHQNVVGLKSGLLTVLREVEKRLGSSSRRVLCHCQCGVQKEVALSSITTGHNKSCGCSRVEFIRLNHNGPVKHGEARGGVVSPEYASWCSMKARCLNPNDPFFCNYGARGIRICKPWIDDVTQFIADMGRRPTLKHTLDRINVNGNYEPGNCRWATVKEQARNRTNSRMLTAFGKTQGLPAWAEEHGLTYLALWQRLLKGWPVERALTEPLHRNARTRV